MLHPASPQLYGIYSLFGTSSWHLLLASNKLLKVNSLNNVVMERKRNSCVAQLENDNFKNKIPSRIWGQMGIPIKNCECVKTISKETDFRKQCLQSLNGMRDKGIPKFI
jgi:hypothetical protein